MSLNQNYILDRLCKLGETGYSLVFLLRGQFRPGGIRFKKALELLPQLPSFNFFITAITEFGVQFGHTETTAGDGVDCSCPISPQGDLTCSDKDTAMVEFAVNSERDMGAKIFFEAAGNDNFCSFRKYFCQRRRQYWHKMGCATHNKRRIVEIFQG